MYCIEVSAPGYNHINFFFESLDQCAPIINASLKEGYKVSISMAKPEETPAEE